MKRMTVAAAALLLLFSLLSGCGQIDETEEEPLFPTEEPTAEAVSTLPADFSLPFLEGQPLNPLTCPDGMQQTVASLLYEGLFHLDQAMEPQPLLCSTYTYDPNTLTYTLTLRTDAVFSDGSPVTAADVKASITAAQSSPRYAQRLSQVKSVSAGEGTVTLTLSHANSGLPALLDVPVFKSGTEKTDVPIGTGPYLFDESAEPCLVASQNWWQGGTQPVERILLVGTADREAMLYRFRSRDVQVISVDLTGTEPSAVSGSARCVDADTAVFQYLCVNTDTVSDPALRRCLSRGINRSALVSGLLSGHAKAAQFPLSPVSDLYPAELEEPYSAATFAEVVRDCGELPGRPLRLLVNEENAFKVSMARQIASAFTEAGIAVEAEVLSWEDYTAALTAGQFDLCYCETRLSADWDISPLLMTGGSLNYGGWSDTQCDYLLEAYRTAGDRSAAMNSLCRYLQKQAPLLPICFKTVSILCEPEVVEGLTPTAAEPFYELAACQIHLREA